MSDVPAIQSTTPAPAPLDGLPTDQQARQIALLEKIVEQQAALLIATQAGNRPLTKDATMRVRVIDFGMGFWSLVNFFLTAVFAAIPAGVILGIFWIIVMLFFGGLLRALG